MRYMTFAVMALLFWLWFVTWPRNSNSDLPFFLSSSFVVIKIIIGVNLLGYATRRRAGMEEREAKDVVNDFGRDPIGEGKEEQVRYFSPL